MSTTLTTRDQFQAYFDRLAPLLGLGHWTIKVRDRQPLDPDAYAAVTCWDGRHGASIFIGESLLKGDDPEEQRYCAAQELLHCHHALADRIAEEGLPEAARGPWKAAMEYAIDGQARAVAKFLPLPECVLDKPEIPAPIADRAPHVNGVPIIAERL